MSEGIIEVEVDRFARFNRGGVYYAFVNVPVNMLSIEVPGDAHEKGKVIIEPTEYAEDGTLIKEEVSRQKTMAEFMLAQIHSLDGTEVIAPLSAMDRPTLRERKTTRSDLEQWEGFVSSYGLTVDKWLTIDQRNDLLNSKKYKVVDD